MGKRVYVFLGRGNMSREGWAYCLKHGIAALTEGENVELQVLIADAESTVSLQCSTCGKALPHNQ